MNWQDIRRNIFNRVIQNRKRLASCEDEESFAVLNRIAHDDEQRLTSATQWVEYHHNAA